MGNSANKFRKALQQGDEVLACQLYVQNPDLRERLDPNSPNKDNDCRNTPLHLAAKYGMKSLLRDFLIRGGNPNKQNFLDQTTLHMLMMTPSGRLQVVDQKRLDCLHMLLKWRGKAASDGVREQLILDKTDCQKKTALHFAAASGLSLCVQSLVQHGASVFCEDDKNLSPCDIAEQNQHTAVAAYLETKMVFNLQEEVTLEIEDVNQQSLDGEEYSGLCAQDLQEVKDQLIVETSDMLQVPLFTAEALLRNHEWSREMLLEYWMEDPLVACEKAGVKLAQDHVALDQLKNKLNGARKKTATDFKVELRNHNCDICDEILPSDNSVTEIPCGHMFCNLCWERYLSTKIKDGDTHKILCPGHDCDKLVPVEITEKLVSRDMAKRYLQFDIKAFVDTNPNLRWCPYPGCGRAVKLPDANPSNSASQRQNVSSNAKAKAVDCGRGHYFCWGCLGEAHEPCSCDTWQKWLKTVDDINPHKAQDQVENRESVANAFWLISNSKKCPNCRSHIQKNEGCNHMTCSKCKYDFCWVCLEPWKLHSPETGGYFRCNRYDVTNVLEENHEREFKQIEKEHDEVQRINRFMHYYTRCKNHENSFQMEMKLLNAAEEKVSGLQKAAEQLEIYGDFDANFLEDSITELLKSRQILKGSYPYGYFLENEKGQRTVFESMQDEIEQATETLSGMIAHAFLKTPRKKIINATRKLRRKKREFLSAIERGLVPDDYEMGATPSRSQNQMENGLFELLEAVKLQMRGADGSASSSEGTDTVLKLRRRIEEVCETRDNLRVKSKRANRHKSSLKAEGVNEAEAVINRLRSRRMRSRQALGAVSYDSSSSEEEVGRARQISDPPVVVSDDSDSTSDYMTPNADVVGSDCEPKKTVVVQFDYIAGSPMELSLEAGDIIEVTEKRSDGWWHGKCQGRKGFFPSHFVVELDTNHYASSEALKENVATGQSSPDGMDNMLQQALALSLVEYESQRSSTRLQGEHTSSMPTCALLNALEITESITEPEHEE